MKKMGLFFGLFTLICVACKKNASSISLSGVYTESSPYSGRSQLNFTGNNLVILSEPGSIYKDTFNYTIGSEQITLKPYGVADDTASGIYFNVYNADSFKIASLYASIPESPPTYMVFKK